MFKLLSDLPVNMHGQKKVIPAGSLVKLRPDQAESLMKKGFIKVVCQGEEIDVPDLVNHLAVMSEKETDQFNERYESFRNAGMGSEAAAFMAYCEMKG